MSNVFKIFLCGSYMIKVHSMCNGISKRYLNVTHFCGGKIRFADRFSTYEIIRRIDMR